MLLPFCAHMYLRFSASLLFIDLYTLVREEKKPWRSERSTVFTAKWNDLHHVFGALPSVVVDDSLALRLEP